MKINIHNRCSDFNTYRASRVKSLFNAESGCDFRHDATLDIDDNNWQIGLIVGPSGSGKTSLARNIWDGTKIYNLYDGWHADRPIVDDISPDGNFDEVTGNLAAVGLGDVPAWLRPFNALSNGQQFRAGLARLLSEKPNLSIVDEFTSVVDRQIAKIGAQAFSKSFKRGCTGSKVILISCHYDIIDWLEPDWVYDTSKGEFARGRLWRRPKFDLQIWKVNSSYWKHFKPHYYLDLPMPVAAEYFIGTVDGELVCHLAVAPSFQTKLYRATRLVVMPEWQGAGVGTKFLEWVCEYHLQGNGRGGKKYKTMFHTSHPQLIGYLRRSKKWVLKSQQLFGANGGNGSAKVKNKKSQGAFPVGFVGNFGGHFRAVQGFKYIGAQNG